MSIERHDPALYRIVDVEEPLKLLAEVATDDTGPLEGPVWFPEENYLLFSDIRGSRRFKWSAAKGVELVLSPTNMGNGMTRDRQGRLIVCELGGRRVVRRELDGSWTVIARKYGAKPLNQPNDVVVKSDGSIYFTDPWSPVPVYPATEFDLDHCGVYRLAPDLSSMTLLIKDMVFPNGLAFSPDEKTFYVDDLRREHIRAYDVSPDGSLVMASERIFCELHGSRPGHPDGMKVDVEGNVYCGGSGGVWIISRQGTHLGTIAHGQTKTTNLAWGGPDWKTLFITTHHKLYCMQMNIPGIPVPRGNAA
jgi:gluconolactonase